jgi:hypothetical protein
MGLGLALALTSGCGGHDKSSEAGRSSSHDSASSSPSPSTTPDPLKHATGTSDNVKKPESGDTPDPGVNDNGAPGKVGKKGVQSAVFVRVPGSSAQSCVTVGSLRDVRSGGFVAGPFDDARRSYGKKKPGATLKQVRLYWVPRHSKPMSGVTVVASSGGQRVTVRQKQVADAEQWSFYDTLISLPHKGTWTFRATSGSDRGCFVAKF